MYESNLSDYAMAYVGHRLGMLLAETFFHDSVYILMASFHTEAPKSLCVLLIFKVWS